ncbi:MAG: hypothetical protein AB7Y46_15060 [Armatimonadota bacterium]
MPDKLAALRHLLAASRYGATDHRATIPLEFLDARAAAGWLYWKLSQRQLGEIEPGDIRRIKVLADENALLLVGDAVALDRLQVLIEGLDVPSAAAISLSCLSVETSQPQRLLCQPRAPTLVELPDGSELDAAEELDVGKLCPVAPDYADECVVVVNPYVDSAELDRMIDEGVAEMPWEPRFVERPGLGGAVTFQCEHTMPSGQPGLRLAALVGADGLITVQVSLRCSGEGAAGRGSATVQYVAFPGQTVGIGVIPRLQRAERMPVLLVTADTIDRHARERAHRLARRHTRSLRQRRVGS